MKQVACGKTLFGERCLAVRFESWIGIPSAGFNIHQAALRLQGVVASCPRGGRKFSKVILREFLNDDPLIHTRLQPGEQRMGIGFSSTVSTVFFRTPRDEAAEKR